MFVNLLTANSILGHWWLSGYGSGLLIRKTYDNKSHHLQASTAVFLSKIHIPHCSRVAVSRLTLHSDPSWDMQRKKNHITVNVTTFPAAQWYYSGRSCSSSSCHLNQMTLKEERTTLTSMVQHYLIFIEPVISRNRVLYYWL